MLTYQKKPIGEDFAASFKALTSFIRLAHSEKNKPMRSVREKKRSRVIFDESLTLVTRIGKNICMEGQGNILEFGWNIHFMCCWHVHLRH